MDKVLKYKGLSGRISKALINKIVSDRNVFTGSGRFFAKRVFAKRVKGAEAVSHCHYSVEVEVSEAARKAIHGAKDAETRSTSVVKGRHG